MEDTERWISHETTSFPLNFPFTAAKHSKHELLSQHFSKGKSQVISKYPTVAGIVWGRLMFHCSRYRAVQNTPHCKR